MRYAWITAAEVDDGPTWARCLVEEVNFDLAGFPAVLRSRAVNELFGVTHVFGSSYHPQSQGYIEARHKPIAYTLAAYADKIPGNWATTAKLAQWALRSTPRQDRGGKSPFELVTCLRPQGPLNRPIGRASAAKIKVDPGTYGAELCSHLEEVHKVLRTPLL